MTVCHFTERAVQFTMIGTWMTSWKDELVPVETVYAHTQAVLKGEMTAEQAVRRITEHAPPAPTHAPRPSSVSPAAPAGSAASPADARASAAAAASSSDVPAAARRRRDVHVRRFRRRAARAAPEQGGRARHARLPARRGSARRGRVRRVHVHTHGAPRHARRRRHGAGPQPDLREGVAVHRAASRRQPRVRAMREAAASEHHPPERCAAQGAQVSATSPTCASIASK